MVLSNKKNFGETRKNNHHWLIRKHKSILFLLNYDLSGRLPRIAGCHQLLSPLAGRAEEQLRRASINRAVNDGGYMLPPEGEAMLVIHNHSKFPSYPR